MVSDFECSAVVIDHARNPRNVGPLNSCDGHARITGPYGDTMEFWLQIRDGRIQRANFTTDGCGSSLVCGSMTTELATARTLEEARGIQPRNVLDAFRGFPEEVQHCALLATDTLHAACEDFINKRSLGQGDEPTESGYCDSCDSSPCSTTERRQDESEEGSAERQLLESRLCHIRHKLLILAGKGGVGKSTVAANLAVSLARAGQKVGLLDIDVHGPSIPKLLGLEDREDLGTEEGMLSVRMNANPAVMSIWFLAGNEKTLVVWRGPMKHGVIRKCLKDVTWGELDFLVVDSPRGTGNEPLSVAQLIGSGSGALIVTTPQNATVADVRRCISLCNRVSVPVVGIVESMSGHVCSRCGESINISKIGSGEALAEEMRVPFLGKIPIDPQIVASGGMGTPFAGRETQTQAAAAFSRIVPLILAAVQQDDAAPARQDWLKETH